jgi:hypothetical protein
MKARTLATGIGQTANGAREHGSRRTEKVIAGIKPGQVGLDRGMKPHVDKRDTQEAMCAKMHMDPVNEGPDTTQKWPLESGSKSHEAAGKMTDPCIDDQGEQERVAQTGRKAHAAVNQGA